MSNRYKETVKRLAESVSEIKAMFNETGLFYDTAVGCYEEIYAVMLILIFLREFNGFFTPEELREVRKADMLPPLLPDERLKELFDARTGMPDIEDMLDVLRCYLELRDELEEDKEEILSLDRGNEILAELLPVPYIGNGTPMDLDDFDQRIKLYNEMG